MPNQHTRTDYYLEQANKCAKAASSTSITEIREAYANLQQGWLRLVPKPAEGESDDGVSNSRRHPPFTKKPH